MSKVLVGVGAVVFKDDEVLLIKRGKEPFLGQWSIPGGRLEFGENLRAAVMREVLEETGVSIEITGLIDAFDALPSVLVPDRHFVLIDYVARWVSGRPCAGDDAADAQFMPYNDAVKRVHWDQTRLALQRAREIRDSTLKRP